MAELLIRLQSESIEKSVISFENFFLNKNLVITFVHRLFVGRLRVLNSFIESAVVGFEKPFLKSELRSDISLELLENCLRIEKKWEKKLVP